MAKPLIKPSHRGLLHKELGVKQGQKIPESKLQTAAKSSNPALRKRAVFAQNFGHPGSEPLQTEHTSKHH